MQQIYIRFAKKQTFQRSYFVNEPQYSRSIELQLPVPTSNMTQLLHYAGKGLSMIFKSGHKYKKVGIFLNNLVPADAIQGTFVDNVDRKNKTG